MIDKFNEWLLIHMGIKKTDRLSDENLRDLHIMLGGSFGQAIQQFRSGHRTAPHLLIAIRELVEIGDPQKARVFRRDEALAESLRFAVKMHSDTGHAPDGGEMEAWAFLSLSKLNISFSVGEDIEIPAVKALWKSIFTDRTHSLTKQESPANIYRRKRLSALAA